MQKRRSKRKIKRLEIKFVSDGNVYRGITSDISREGLFIRTKKGLPPGTIIELDLFLPSGEIINLQARVKRTVKTMYDAIKNGMGVEIIDIPPKYLEFLQSLQ